MKKFMLRSKKAGVLLLSLLTVVLIFGLCRVDASAAGTSEIRKAPGLKTEETILKKEAASGETAAASESAKAEGAEEEPTKVNYFRLIMFILSPFIIFGFGIVGIVLTNKHVQKKQQKQMSDALVERENQKNSGNDQDNGQKNS